MYTSRKACVSTAQFHECFRTSVLDCLHLTYTGASTTKGATN